MNIGSSVLQIVVEPAIDCCRYAGAVDTIEQFLMVHIVEYSCQIERDEYCSVSRFFHEKPSAISAVIVDSAVHVECFGRRPYRARWKGMCVSILGSRWYYCV